MAEKSTPSEQTVRAWARLIRVSQSLLARVERRLRKAGFPPLGCYDALLELQRAGEAGLRPVELQREMLLAQYSMSRLTDRMAKDGCIEIHPCAVDGRGQILKISDRGRALLADMWPVYSAAIEAEFGAHLAPGEAEQLANLFLKLQKGGTGI